MLSNFNKAISLIITFFVALMVVGCNQPSNSSKVNYSEQVKLRSCVTTKASDISFDEMLSVLEKFSLQHSMRLLNGGKSVHMQADDPYFTVIYMRNQRSINRVEVFHLDDGAEELEKELFELIGELAIMKDCGGYTSSIPKEWKL